MQNFVNMMRDRERRGDESYDTLWLFACFALKKSEILFPAKLNLSPSRANYAGRAFPPYWATPGDVFCFCIADVCTPYD
jgi:hypothetical protein